MEKEGIKHISGWIAECVEIDSVAVEVAQVQRELSQESAA